MAERLATVPGLLPPTVRRWLVERPEAMTTDLDGVLMSADISGFTRLAEKLAHLGGRQASEMLIRTINQCFDPMIDRVAELGGDVLKFGGDALFAIFPAGQSTDGDSTEEAVLRAARCAADMMAILDQLGAELPTPLSMTVGLANGPVELVLAGSSRRELIVRGPIVDECLTLEGEAEPGEILVCASTAAALPAGWVDESEPGVRLLNPPDGDPFDVGAAETGSAAQSPGSGAGDPNELAAVTRAVGAELMRAYEAFIGTVGETRLVTVSFLYLPTGDLGVGELSALVERLLDRCERCEATLLGSDVAVGGVKFMLSAGAPASGEDDEDAMLAVLSDLVFADDAPPMWAGVNRGLVYAGFLGSERNRTFTTMGDPTNLAARLLGRAEPGSVVVAQSVLDNASAAWSTTELAPILVRGRHEPVIVHRLGLVDAGRRVTRPRPGLVGRAGELDAIDTALSTARRGQGSIIEFRGPRGRGLSRLLDEADERRPDGVVRFRLHGRASPGSAPFAGVGAIVGSVAGVGDDPDPRSRIHELRAWLERVAPESVELAPLLAPMFGLEMPATEQSAAIKPEFRLTLGAELMASILARSLSTPTLFLIDDLHRVDAASVAVLAALAVEVPSQPWLLVTTGRTGTDGLTPGGDSKTLGPLSVEETTGLVAELAPDMDDGTRRTVVDSSAGNPLLAVEMARATIASSIGGSLGPVDSIESLITAQIDRLGHHPRLVLRTASVLGLTFDATTVAAQLDMEPPDLDLGALDELIDQLGGTTYGFRSAAVREVAYGGLSNQRRTGLHAAAAAMLDERGAESADLAVHHSRAGHHRIAVEHAGRAAENAIGLGLLDDAGALLRLQIDSIDNAELSEGETGELLVDALPRLFEVAGLSGRHGEAIAAGERVLDLLDERLPWIRLFIELTQKRAEADGSYDTEIALLTDELDRCDPTDPIDEAAKAWLGQALAALKYRRGEYDDALLLAGRAADDAKATDQLEPRASALLIRHAILCDRGAPDRHQAWSDLLDAGTELGDSRLLTFAHNNVALDHQDSGDWSAALDHYDEAARHAIRCGDRHRHLFPAINRAGLRLDQGHWDEARVELDRLRRDAARDESGFATAWAQHELGRLEVAAGRPDDGRRHLVAARAWFDEAGNVVDAHDVDLSLLAAELAAGRSQDVLDGAAALTRPEESTPRLSGWLETLIGFALLQQGQPESGADWFEQAIAANAETYRFGHAHALVGRSEAERFQGRKRAATRTRNEADTILDELGVVRLPYIPLPS